MLEAAMALSGVLAIVTVLVVWAVAALLSMLVQAALRWCDRRAHRGRYVIQPKGEGQDHDQ